MQWLIVILIVDDVPDGADALCRLLARAGYPCENCTTGREAMARIRSHPPEQPLLVVMDYMMPEMSGIEVLRAIRQDPRIAHAPVLFLTAGFDVAVRDEAMMLGAVAWLLKGTDIASILTTIERWYEKSGGVKASKPISH